MNEAMLAEIAEQALDELDLDCAILDIFETPAAPGQWCFDLTGTWGQVCVDLDGACTRARVKERIKDGLLSIGSPG